MGRSMVGNVQMASQLQYLDGRDGTLVNLNEVRSLPPERVVLITTGSQGEPTSALVRIANRDHRDVSIEAGDTVIISATPIPGNELLVSRNIDNLLRQGAHVLQPPNGHGARSRPRQPGRAEDDAEPDPPPLLCAGARRIPPPDGPRQAGLGHGPGRVGIFVLEDGDVLELSEEGGRVVETVSVGPVLIDGRSARDQNSEVLRERKALARDGVVVIVVTVDDGSGVPIKPTKVLASGFMEKSETGELFPKLAEIVDDLVYERQDVTNNPDRIKSLVREAAGRFIQTEARRRPTIVPVVLSV